MHILATYFKCHVCKIEIGQNKMNFPLISFFQPEIPAPFNSKQEPFFMLNNRFEHTLTNIVKGEKPSDYDLAFNQILPQLTLYTMKNQINFKFTW
jgi:hypothetical protein